MNSRTTIFCSLAILSAIIATGLVYWQGLSGPFILDDQANILRAHVEYFDWDAVLYSVTHNTSGILGRPVSMLSLIFSGIVHGALPWGYKYHNLAIHLLNGLLLFWLFIKILPLMSSQLSREKMLLVCGLAVFVWLLHPLMVSTVLYAVQRMAQLSTLFTLIALLSYVAARLNISKRKFYFLAYGLFPLATLLALFSKENGALIPFFVVAIELFAFQFHYDNSSERKKLYCFLLIFIALPLLLGSLYLFTHLDQFTDYSRRNFTLTERLFTQLQLVLVFYPKLIFMPRLADMTLFHDSMDPVRNFNLLTGILFLALLGLSYAIFHFRKKAPIIAFSLAWYLIAHLLESTFLPLELAFEHRNYLAAVGPLLALIYYLFSIEKYPSLKYVSILAIALLAFMTIARVQEWKTEDVFYRIAINDHPESMRAQAGMARYQYNTGNLAAAIEHLEIAQEANPDILGADLHEILFLCGTGEDLSGDLDNAIAKAEFYPLATYELNTLDAILGLKRVAECPEVNLQQILSLLDVMAKHSLIEGNQLYQGYIDRFKAQSYIFSGNYLEGLRYYEQAYERAQLASFLVELIDIQLRVNQLHGAEESLIRLKLINERSFGIETSLILILQERLDFQRNQNELETIGFSENE